MSSAQFFKVLGSFCHIWKSFSPWCTKQESIVCHKSIKMASFPSGVVLLVFYTFYFYKMYIFYFYKINIVILTQSKKAKVFKYLLINQLLWSYLFCAIFNAEGIVPLVPIPAVYYSSIFKSLGVGVERWKPNSWKPWLIHRSNILRSKI